MTKFDPVSVVTVHEAKTHLSRLIQRALAGEEIIIAKRESMGLVSRDERFDDYRLPRIW